MCWQSAPNVHCHQSCACVLTCAGEWKSVDAFIHHLHSDHFKDFAEASKTESKFPYFTQSRCCRIQAAANVGLEYWEIVHDETFSRYSRPRTRKTLARVLVVTPASSTNKVLPSCCTACRTVLGACLHVLCRAVYLACLIHNTACLPAYLPACPHMVVIWLAPIFCLSAWLPALAERRQTGHQMGLTVAEGPFQGSGEAWAWAQGAQIYWELSEAKAMLWIHTFADQQNLNSIVGFCTWYDDRQNQVVNRIVSICWALSVQHCHGRTLPQKRCAHHCFKHRSTSVPQRERLRRTLPTYWSTTSWVEMRFTLRVLALSVEKVGLGTPCPKMQCDLESPRSSNIWQHLSRQWVTCVVTTSKGPLACDLLVDHTLSLTSKIQSQPSDVSMKITVIYALKFLNYGENRKLRWRNVIYAWHR